MIQTRSNQSLSRDKPPMSSVDSGLGTSCGSDVTDMSVLRDSVDSGFVEYDFLFPNGIMVSQECKRDSTLSDVKTALWDKVTRQPGAKFLRDSSRYVFIGWTPDNTETEINEGIRFSDIRLVSPLLQVSEPICSRDLNELYNKTGEAIGIPVQTIEQKDSKVPEQKHFRIELMHVCRDIVRMREEWSIEEKLLFSFPPKLDLNRDLPLCTERKLLKAKNIIREVHVYLVEPGETYNLIVQVNATDTPTDVIKVAVAERCRVKGHDEATTRQRVQGAWSMYVLKVCGREDYMLQESCIHCYEYVRTCINNDEVPKLQLVSRENLLRELPQNNCVILQQELPPRPSPAPFNKSSDILSWDVPYDTKYQIKVLTQPGRRNFGDELCVEAQLFNGDQPLCEPKITHTNGYKQAWTFDVAIQALPRNARLCFITFALKNGRKIKSVNWANLQVFNHSGRLVTGEQTLNVFDFPDLPRNELIDRYPQGTPGSNWESSAHPLCIEVLPPWSKQVVYPPDQHIDNIIARERSYTIASPDKTPFGGFDKLAARDPLYQLTDEEKTFLWKNRETARGYSSKLLPKLISAVDWKDRHQVFQLHELLSDHPPHDDLLDSLTLPSVLQMLGPKCQDKKARTLAVRWMRRHLDPVQIELYLLQLVQILKFECYQNNEFTQFLLEKALLHKSIGHKFFWLLRAELDKPASRGRFALLLEAYCVHCGADVLDQRLNEVVALKQFSSITTAVKEEDLSLREQQKRLSDWVKDNSRAVLEHMPSMMHPPVMLDELVESECKVMSSKMKPLFITWANQHDPSCGKEGSKVRYIVKNGDDLRQDMLVVQMLRVMDMIWKTSCSDFRPTIYDCLALNSDIGLIEVVPNAQTLCEIQQKTKKGTTDKEALHAWLYQKTMDNIGFTKAGENFMHSSAGFCVTTFLLGVGDRHSDNIMVNESGDIFNIDFGHFMGHKKSKANIQRERTPFILTKDFVNIIRRGTNEKDNLFQTFLFLCYEAYMTIRLHSDLIISLLSLMMYADLRELSQEKDIRYCQDCLGLDKTDHEAAKMFYNKLMQSYKGQWSTQLNWFFHRFNKEMKSMSSS